MNILELILNEMITDDEDSKHQSDMLVEHYNKLDEPYQRAIDDALICVCGWSMETLIEKADN